jgi:predicted ester cyclase
MYRPFQEACPDLELQILAAFGHGENVRIRWRATGTYRGASLGIHASGRRAQFRGITWQRFCNGCLVEGEDGWNLGGLVRALQCGWTSGSVAILD